MSYPYKQLEVRKVYYDGIGDRFILSIRTLIKDMIAVDQDVYLDRDTASKLVCDLNKLLDE